MADIDTRLKNEQDIRDWFVMFVVTGIVAASTVYLFKHADFSVFTAWIGFVTTIFGVYHWIVFLDDKRPDARG